MGRYATHTSWLPSAGANSLIPGLTSTVANTASVNNEIARAEGFIDSFLGRLYLPSTYATSPTVMSLAEDITTYRIFKSYIYNRPEGISAPGGEDIVSNQYNISLNLLEQLRDGKM